MLVRPCEPQRYSKSPVQARSPSERLPFEVITFFATALRQTVPPKVWINVSLMPGWAIPRKFGNGICI